MTFNTIAFSKGYLLVNDSINPTKEQLQTKPSSKIVEFQAELMRFGYILDETAQYALSKFKDIDTIIKEIIDYLTTTVGDGEFISLFGNFPNSVLAMNDYEFYTHQILHYLFGSLYSPIECKGSEEYNKYSKFLKDSYTKIAICDGKKLCDICKNICSATQSLTQSDKDTIAYFAQHWNDLTNNSSDCFPDEVPFKETACLLYTYGVITPKTVTDVFRQAVYESNGDITLEHPTKFKEFSRKDRRKFLNLVNTILSKNPNSIADMKKYALRWIKLGEVLHPGDYAYIYREAYKAFSILRNDLKSVKTFESELNSLEESNDFNGLLKLLATHPGEYARRLNFLFTKYPEKDKEIILGFKEIVPKLSIKTIYELLDYFTVRQEPLYQNNRRVTPKGHRNTVPIKPLKPLKDINVSMLQTVLREDLELRFKAKGPLPYKVLILDDKLFNIALPKNMRSMNEGLTTSARGTKIPLDSSKDVIRFYTRWEDPIGKEDLDMSASFCAEDFTKVVHLGWNGDRSWHNDTALFSGDVRHREGNCAEYIDFSISKCLEKGIRYVIGFVSDYDAHQFRCKCWSGVMFKDALEAKLDNTWAPDTIEYGFRITTNTANSCITSIIDLKERCLIIVDEDFSQNIASTCNPASILIRYSLPKYFNAYTLIQANAEQREVKIARGTKTTINILKNKDTYINKFKDLYTKVTLSTDDPDKLIDISQDILRKIDFLDRTEVITYDDIINDYTKLFEWMF